MSARRSEPRGWRASLRWSVPARHRTVVLDDLREIYDARRARDGQAAARRWYRREAWRCILSALRLRAQDAAPAERLGAIVGAWRQAARRLAASPAFSITAVGTLGTALGVALTLFALVDAALLRPLPYPRPQELVYVHHRMLQDDQIAEMPLSSPAAQVYRQAESLAGMALWFEAAGNLTDGEDPERIDIAMVSPDLFQVLGAPTELGRGFVRDDALAQPISTIILSHRLWVRRYGADPGIVGRRIEFNGRPREVIGILADHVSFPRRRTQAWMPSFAEPEGVGLGNFDVRGVARLAPGVGLERAAAELDGISAELMREHPSFDSKGLRARLRPLHEQIVGEWSQFLRMLLVVGGLVFGVAAANVGGLLLVRSEHQGHELAVRSALGAGARLRLGFHLAETSLLCAAAGAIALLVAQESIPAVVAAVPAEVPRLDEAVLDGRVAWLTLAVSAGLALVLALLTAGRGGRDEASLALRRAGGSLADGRSALWRQAIIAGQLAVAVALVSIAALMVRSTIERQRVDMGFDAGNVITAQVPLSYRAYPEYADAERFWAMLLRRVRALPGVAAAGAVDALPLADGASRIPLEVRDAPPTDPLADVPMFAVRLVTPGYFEALGVTIREGRFPTDSDTRVRPVLASESLADRLGLRLDDQLRWAREDAEWSTLVGVIADLRDRSPDAEPDDVLYVPVLGEQSFTAFVPRVMSLVVRMQREPASVVPALRSEVRQLDPALPLTRVREMREWVAESTAAATFATLAIAGAAAVAALLGAVGLYGVVAYLVGRRRREIGIRMALGALPARTAMLVVSGSLRPGLVGGLLGVAFAAVGSRLVSRWLFGVSPFDAMAAAITAGILAAVLVVATWVPARRALRVDPASVLRG